MKRLPVAIALLISVCVVSLLAACGGPDHPVPAPAFKTLPAPPLPSGLQAPPSNCQHVMGGCLPHTRGITGDTGLGVVSRPVGPDLSNNDPVSAAAFKSIARVSKFVYLKSVEGGSFTDSTAYGMAAGARAAGLPRGGYDFLHVCLVNPSSEAQHFVAALRAQGLSGSLPPAGDSEYPSSTSCNTRAWLQQWVDTVYSLDGHVCPIMYTGEWWWGPHVGAWWPTCLNVKLRAWISGYGVRWPFTPPTAPFLTLWQYADNGFNGSTHTDMSRVYSTSFLSFAKPGPSKTQVASWTRARDASLRAYHAHRCAQPVLGSRACGTFAQRVVFFQRHIGHVHCFGRGAVVHAPACQVVRPAVSTYSRARNATDRALKHNPRSRILRHRRAYFAGRVKSLMEV